MSNGNEFKDYTVGDWGSMLKTAGMGELALGKLPEYVSYFSSPTGQAFTRTGQGAYSPRKGRYFQQAYQDVYSDYLGQWGGALRAGEAPGSFYQFLQTDPWTRRYSRLPQYERGVTKTYSDPRTRFIYY
jgi:hypothetical protein